MQCHQINLHTATLYLFTLIRIVSCFRSVEAEEKVREGATLAENVANFHEGNENALLRQTEFKRSIDEDEAYRFQKIVNENIMVNNLMALSSPGKLREKRSKRSKTVSKKSSIDSDAESSKDELMNILGTIHEAKHHRLSRKDIRKLAKKAFAKFKLKKKSPKKSDKNSNQKKKEAQKKAQLKDKAKEPAQEPVQDLSENKEKLDPKKQTLETATKDDSETVNTKEAPSKEGLKGSVEKSSSEDEKAFARMFDESASSTKNSELSEDITKLEDNKKINDIVSDDKMSTKSTNKGPNTESLGSKKTMSPTENSLPAKTTAKQIEQELNKEFDMKENQKGNPDLTVKPVEAKHETSKKSNIPDGDRKEKIKTLKTLLAKANKNRVPKKFLGKFPAGLRMIAWRELLDKKKKELAELENMKDDEKSDKKEVSVSPDTHPLTIDINIDPTGEKSPKVSAKKEESGLENVKASKESGSHHIASHVKYLQKHLAGAQDLRKLISRALIGHCHATGKRILKAFIAMDRALTRAQKIATVIGKKFKVDATKIENIVVHKEDEVVESFLRDIFANFN